VRRPHLMHVAGIVILMHVAGAVEHTHVHAAKHMMNGGEAAAAAGC
jgi:hypothetical protein